MPLLLPSHVELPPAPRPVANYVPVVADGNRLYTAGMIPTLDGVLRYTGAVGSIGVSVEEGQAAARLCLLNALSALNAHLEGDLDRIVQVIKLTAYVSSAPGFYQQPQVINGASDLLVEIFGAPRGQHARAAVGVNALPMDASVELDLIVAVRQ